ncbi:MAG: class I SAM-dependent methyltransferase [Methanothrix sp.]
MEWDNFDYARIKEMREKYIPLKEVVSFIQLNNGENLIDIGAGDGHYSIAFASAFPKSKITALEPSTNGVNLITKRIENSGVSNVKVIKADVCTLKDFSPYSVVFFSNVFHDLPCREELIRSISKTIAAKSEAIFIEFSKNAIHGPPQEIRISEKELEGIMSKNGARLLGSKHFEINYMHKYIFG